MPILWRYLLSRYLGILFFSSCTFLFLLVSFRFHEIAQFAAFGASTQSLLWFIFLQIPYILPVVVPISSLLAAYLLSIELSRTHELTSIRACGYSLRSCLAPVVCMAFTLSFANFFLVSDVATSSHLHTRMMEREFKGINPLVLLQHPELLKMKGIEITSLDSIKPGEEASELIVAVPHEKRERLMLLLANQLKKEGSEIQGQDITFLMSVADEKRPKILIDHASGFSTPQDSFSRLLKGESSKVGSDYLSTPLLIWKLWDMANKPNSSYLKMVSDLFRRFSIALAPLTFTLLGLSYGLWIGRKTNQRKLLEMILLAALYLTAFFIAKSFEKRLFISISLYIIPHVMIILFSLRRLTRISKGML